MTNLEVLAQVKSSHLWFYVWKLLRLRWLLFASGFKRAKPIRKFFTIFLGVLALGVFAGSFLLTTFLLGLLKSPLIIESGINLSAFVSAIPVVIVSGVFLVILLTSFGVLLQALYLANDMDFLLTAPVPIRAVFLSKLLQAILPSFTLVVLIGLPILFGLGAAGKYHILYFPFVVIALAFLSLAAAGISSLLVMGVVRIFPAKRVAEVLAFFGAILSIVLSQWNNLTGADYGTVTPEQFSRTAETITRFDNAWSPLAWAGRGLTDIGQAHWFSGLFFLFLTLGLASGVFWLALNAAERLYYSGWASIQVGTQHKKGLRKAARSQKSGAAVNLFGRMLPVEVRAVMLKDFRELRRDLRNMSQVITSIIFGIIFTVMILRGGGEPPAGRGEAPALFLDIIRSALAYASMAISLFVGWSLLQRLAIVSFSMEGRSYWIIKASPVSAGKLLTAKFLMAYLPVLAMSWLFLVVIALLQKAPSAAILYGFPSVALILAGLDGINLAFGVSGANLTWTDPRKMSAGASGCLGLIISSVYLVGTLALFFLPPIGSPFLGMSEGTGQLIGLLAGGTVALLCTILPLALVKNRVYRIGEDQ